MKHEQREEYNRVRQLFRMVSDNTCVKKEIYEPFNLKEPAGIQFVPYVPAALHALLPYMPTTLMLMKCSSAYCPTCRTCLLPYVSYVPLFQ